MQLEKALQVGITRRQWHNKKIFCSFEKKFIEK